MQLTLAILQRAAWVDIIVIIIIIIIITTDFQSYYFFVLVLKHRLKCVHFGSMHLRLAAWLSGQDVGHWLADIPVIYASFMVDM